MNPFKFDEDISSPNTVKEFFYQSWFRSLGQSLNIKYWSFFITGIIIFGGCGIWVEIGKTLTSTEAKVSFTELNKSIIFYITTILGATCSQILLDKSITPIIKSGSWLLIILIYFLTAGVGFIQDSYPDTRILLLLIPLCLISLSIVWLINTFNGGLTGPSITASIGGDLDDERMKQFQTQVETDADGYKV